MPARPMTILRPRPRTATAVIRSRDPARLCTLTRRAPRWWRLCIGVGVLGALVASPRCQQSQAEELVPVRVVDGAIPTPLTTQPGDAARGRQLVFDRESGDCTICHAMPLPHRQFHGTIGPALDGIGCRVPAGVLRLRLVDPKVLSPGTIMPAYYKVAGLHRVLDRYQGVPLLTAQQIEDVLAYLLTLTHGCAPVPPGQEERGP